MWLSGNFLRPLLPQLFAATPHDRHLPQFTPSAKLAAELQSALTDKVE
jgi:hypothetical protein